MTDSNTLSEYDITIHQLLEGHVTVYATSYEEALRIADQKYNHDGEDLPDMDDVEALRFSIDAPHRYMQPTPEYPLHKFIEEEVPFRLTEVLGYKYESEITKEEISKLISIVKNNDNIMFDFDAFDQFLSEKLEEIRQTDKSSSLEAQISIAKDKSRTTEPVNQKHTPDISK